MGAVSIVGCGELGRRVASLHRHRGEPCHALVRTPASAAVLRRMGIAAMVADLDCEGSPAGLPTGAGRMYYFVAPPVDGITDARLERFLGSCASPARVVYVSTSGVYGDAGGAWIDESWPLRPSTDRSRRRLWAEERLQAYLAASGGELVVLRVGGIYGPGRLPLQRVYRCEPVLREQDCPFTNRIHLEDLARVCLAAMDRGRPGAIYNAVDGRPGTMTGYFKAVADRMGLPRPPEVGLERAQQALSRGLLSYLGESRRVSNRKMLEELAVTLVYPTLEAGLAACDPATERRCAGLAQERSR